MALHYKYISKPEEIEEAIKKFDEEPLLAVDCEGVNLNRTGELTVVTIATPDEVYIFDVKELKNEIFDKGLRELLQEEGKEKLMFDCRNDSDALGHQFNVKLAGVLDMQLYDCMYRLGENNTGINFMRGYQKCLSAHLYDTYLVGLKQSGSNFLNDKAYKWAERPLSKQMLEYAAGDVVGLFKLYDFFKARIGTYMLKERLEVASSRYVALYRDKGRRTLDKFEFNARLPLFIIPKVLNGRVDKTLPSEYNNVQCATCLRKMPYHETTIARQNRNKVRVCQNCKKILAE